MRLTERLKKLFSNQDDINPSAKKMNADILTGNQMEIWKTFKPAGIATPIPPLLSFLDFFKGWAFACANKRATSISMKYNFGVWEVLNNDDKPVPANHWLNSLIMNPNRPLKMSWTDIKRLVVNWLDYWGNAYLYCPLNGAKFPNQIWVLESNRVWMNPGTEGRLVDSYSYSNWNGLHKFPADEVCHVKTLLPSNRIYENFYIGQASLLNAAINSIQADENQKTFLTKFYERDGRQDLTINTPASMNPFNQDEKEQIKKLMTDPEIGRYVLAYLPMGAEFKGLPTNTLGTAAVGADMSKDKNIDIICAIFGTPKELFNPDASTFAEAKVAASHYETNTVEPLMQHIESALTTHFRQYEDAIKITHKPTIYQDIDEEVKIKTFMFNSGCLNRNEIRAGEGLAKIQDGDNYFISSTLVPVDNLLNPPVIEKSAEIPQEPIEDNNLNKSLQVKKKAYHELTEPEKYRIWKSYEKENSKFTLKLKNVLKDNFDDLKSEVLDNIDNIKLKSYTTKAIERNIDLFDITKWLEILSKALNPDIAKIVIAAIQGIIKQSGSSAFEASEWTKTISKATNLSTAKIKEPLETIKKELTDLIHKTIENPDIPKENLKESLKSLISDRFDNIYKKSRIDNIAQTTTTFTSGKAADLACNDLDLEKVWMSERDGRVRPTHTIADGQRAKNGIFSVGADKMEHPGGGTLPEENCNCRCFMFSQKKE